MIQYIQYQKIYKITECPHTIRVHLEDSVFGKIYGYRSFYKGDDVWIKNDDEDGADEITVKAEELTVGDWLPTKR